MEEMATTSDTPRVVDDADVLDALYRAEYTGQEWQLPDGSRIGLGDFDFTGSVEGLGTTTRRSAGASSSSPAASPDSAPGR